MRIKFIKLYSLKIFDIFNENFETVKNHRALCLKEVEEEKKKNWSFSKMNLKIKYFWIEQN